MQETNTTNTTNTNNRLSNLKRQVKSALPFMRIHVAGQGNCLVNEEGLLLTIFLRPLSTKLLLQSSDFIGIIEKFELAKSDLVDAKKAASEKVAKMNIKEKIQTAAEMTELIQNIFKDYAVCAGYFTEEELRPQNRNKLAELVSPIKFVDSDEEAEGLNEADDTKLYVPIGWLSDDEIMETMSFVQELQKTLPTSEEPIIDLVEGEGGESEAVSPAELNRFPTRL